MVDGAAYFRLVKAAIAAARYSILLLGWDFDPRIRLEPDRPDNSRPDQLGALLKRLLAERESLHVHILIWDMVLPIAANRRFVPQRARSWLRADRLYYRLDDRHPFGSCHHQKLLVIDDAIAFCGGMDFAGNRWDTPVHPDRDPRRRTPEGRAYQPRHDVMLAVTGAAAAALGDLARERWRRATGERIEPPPAGNRIWPEGLRAEFTDVPVAIARTEPAWHRQEEVRENEALFGAAIAAARRWIYLESQYVAAPGIAAALAARLAATDGPEAVIVCPAHSPSYFDRLAMDPARAGFVRRLRAADRHGRFRILTPVAAFGTPIVVHSKVMVVDDRLLRVGSANLNNRSLGFDTECDLAIGAMPGEPGAGRVQEAIGRVLVRLLAEHLGVPTAELAATLERTGSLVATIDTLDRGSGRCLRPPTEPARTGLAAMIEVIHLFDPLGAADAWRPCRRLRSARPRSP